MWQYNYPNTLAHHGILGMHWGHRKNYSSTSIRSVIAKKQNDKVDEGFKNWNENAKKKDTAINLGKKATSSRLAYEHDKSNKDLRNQYRSDNKTYKKSLKQNTTYHKGQIKQEVGKELSRNYLTEAKRIKKQLDSDPTNKELQKKYSDFMSKHDIERAKARRAPEVAANRSQKKASIKRKMTMTVKAAAATATVSAGAYAVNRYLKAHDVTLNGQSIRVGQDAIEKFNKAVKVGKEVFNYV